MRLLFVFLRESLSQFFVVVVRFWFGSIGSIPRVRFTGFASPGSLHRARFAEFVSPEFASQGSPGLFHQVRVKV